MSNDRSVEGTRSGWRIQASYIASDESIIIVAIANNDI